MIGSVLASVLLADVSQQALPLAEPYQLLWPGVQAPVTAEWLSRLGALRERAYNG